MTSISRDFFVDSISGSAVQLRRSPLSTPLGDTCSGVQIHQANLVLGITAATTAEAGAGAFWQANCTRYRLTVERIS